MIIPPVVVSALTSWVSEKLWVSWVRPTLFPKKDPLPILLQGSRVGVPPLKLDELIPGAKHFAWGELLYCPTWEVSVFPTLEQYQNLILTARSLELVRALLNRPVEISSGLRPPLYNELIHGALNSAHLTGEGADFWVSGMPADRVRELLAPKLEEWGLCMERNPSGNWVHIDRKAPRESGRYFIP